MNAWGLFFGGMVLGAIVGITAFCLLLNHLFLKKKHGGER
jgi:hypothetical protein